MMTPGKQTFAQVTSGSTSSSSVAAIPVPRQMVTHGHVEPSTLPITGYKLNGQNYIQWSQSVLMYICGKDKDDYLTGVAAAPPMGDP